MAPWWHLYRITIRGFEGGSASYRVVTSKGQIKAAAIAGAVHRAKGRDDIWEVELVDEGPVPTDATGLAIVPPDAYDDRMEW